MTSAISSSMPSIYSLLGPVSSPSSQVADPIASLLQPVSPISPVTDAPSSSITNAAVDLPSEVLSLLQGFGNSSGNNIFSSLIGGSSSGMSDFITDKMYESVGADLTAAAYYGHATKAYDAVNAGVSKMVNDCSSCSTSA